jgi:hypothetical protein
MSGFINVVCCEVEVQGQFLVQGSPTDCVLACVRVCLLARAWIWSRATVTLYTYIDYVEARLTEERKFTV